MDRTPPSDWRTLPAEVAETDGPPAAAPRTAAPRPVAPGTPARTAAARTETSGTNLSGTAAPRRTAPRTAAPRTPRSGTDPSGAVAAAGRTPAVDRDARAATAARLANRLQSRRRHPARKTRVAAVGLSVVATGTITGVFAHADRASAATTASIAKTFTGVPSTMRWGTTRVKIVVKNKAITDVVTLTMPSHTPKSIRLSTNATKVLRTEVLKAHDANVDTVSGATMTSDSYLESLQSAIDEARAAGALA